ncbi:outer membrane beta-barrel protein [Microbulbifer sp. VAAC004]|uniref:outer membrane beta-barrel protein n=1 Tax=unclassified Microbulbifer TaxID=2619833 RepID=UPI00403A0DA6
MKRLAPAFALIIFASPNIAQDNNLYIKSSYGIVDADADTLQVNSSFIAEVTKSQGWNLILGFRLNNFLAFEGGYTDLGESEDNQKILTRSHSDEYDPSGEHLYHTNYKVSLSGNSKTLGVLVTTDITKKFHAGLRLGYQQWKTIYESKEVFLHRYTSVSSMSKFRKPYEEVLAMNSEKTSSDGSDPYYGVSFGFTHNNWGLSLEHTIYEMNQYKPSLSSLAITYNF